ncbi:hypothetical protein HYX19_04175 [Candidatus Woesearchaeota archaeon]|nr:hypothetical protein [Candidatus Woesearchaeota archaeon]
MEEIKMKENENKDLEAVVYMGWEESERGWGTRPDGCSLHLTESDFKAFEKEYWDRMPSTTPDEYSRPIFLAEPVIVAVSKPLYEKIRSTKNGLRLFQSKQVEAVRNKDLVYKL